MPCPDCGRRIRGGRVGQPEKSVICQNRLRERAVSRFSVKVCFGTQAPSLHQHETGTKNAGPWRVRAGKGACVPVDAKAVNARDIFSPNRD